VTMQVVRSPKLVPYGLFLLAFTYYSLLSAKGFTWLFSGGDSGDWLTASTWWIVPQSMGSPLYILLGHFLNLFPGDLAVKMTVLLSCLPAAVTVALVYLIVKRLTERVDIGVASALIVLGATVLLTQATILEEYALTAMFITLAYWLYLREKKMLTGVVLGLGTAVHIIVLPLTLLWLVVERKRWRQWTKPMGVYVGICIGFYSLILVLMATKATPLIAGYLSWNSVSAYFFGDAGATVGNGSIMDFPLRIGIALGITVVSLGLAVIPLTRAFGRFQSRQVWVLLVLVLFPLWFYTTNLCPSTWVFLSLAIPSCSTLSGIGLARMSTKSTKSLKAIATCAVTLILLNAAFMNAHILAKSDPQAMEVLEEFRALPQDSAVVTYYGSYAFALFYTMADGREDIAPLMFADYGSRGDYLEWLEEEYALSSCVSLKWMGKEHTLYGENTLRLIDCALKQGRDVYLVGEAQFYESIDSEMWEELETRYSIVGDSWIKELTEDGRSKE